MNQIYSIDSQNLIQIVMLDWP